MSLVRNFIFINFVLISNLTYAQVETLNNHIKIDSVDVTFSNGSLRLSSDEESKLKIALKKARDKGDISVIKLAVWSDKENPILRNLPAEDYELAKSRIESIKAIINDDRDFEVNNMSEAKYWLYSYYYRIKNELKSFFINNKSELSLEQESFEAINEKGAPSKAIIILEVNMKRKALVDKSMCKTIFARN